MSGKKKKKKNLTQLFGLLNPVLYHSLSFIHDVLDFDAWRSLDLECPVGLHGIGVRQLFYLSFTGSLFWIFRILMHDFLWIAQHRFARAFVPSHFPRLGLYSGYFGIRCVTFSGFGVSIRKIARDRFTVLLLTNWGFILYISEFDA